MPTLNRTPYGSAWTDVAHRAPDAARSEPATSPDASVPRRPPLHVLEHGLHPVAVQNTRTSTRGQEAAPSSIGTWRAVLAYADAVELRIVRRFVSITRFRVVRWITVAVNTLGNGWIYAPIAVALMLSGMRNVHAVMVAALLATLIAHALYALLKRSIARLRPFEKDPSLTPLARVLDRYSFPSGHCMTLAAVLVPITHAAPASWPFAAGALGMLACCRLASAHHYPSDVLAGLCLGAATAAPVCAWLLG